jgi:hypothetical protein
MRRGAHRPAIEPRKYPFPGRRRSADGRQYGWARYRERPDGPAWSETHWPVRTLLAREPGDPTSDRRRVAGLARIGKARSRSR